MLLTFAMLNGCEDARQSRNNVRVHGDANEDQDDGREHFGLVRRSDVAIANRADSDYGPVAGCDVTCLHGLVIDPLTVDPTHEVFLS